MSIAMSGLISSITVAPRIGAHLLRLMGCKRPAVAQPCVAACSRGLNRGPRMFGFLTSCGDNSPQQIRIVRLSRTLTSRKTS